MIELKDLARELDRFRLRILAAALFVLLGFGLLTARLVYLQVIRHDELAIKAEANRTAIVPIVPNRGRIVDRHGVVLANNYTAYTLEIMPSKVDDLEATINGLAELVDIRPSDRRRFKRQLEESKSFESLPIRNRLSETEMARFIAQRFRFPGVDIKARLFRNYPLGDTGSHLIGYIGRINQSEKQAMEDWEEETQANYRGTEYIGKLGLEQSYESELHGRTGVEQVETSAGGRAVRRLASKPSTPGNTLILSIDIKLQALVEQLFGERRGALVAIDPRNGEVLAFVSKPTFDPNLFVDGIDQENWSALNQNIDKPLLNRAIRGTYPPGSTFKPFMAMAALNSGKRAASTVIMDNLSYSFGGRTFGSPETDRAGPKDMRAAIVTSSNVYFYSLANEMGVDLIHDQLEPFGLGRKTGIDMEGELTGDLPSTEWKRRRFKKPEQQKWYAGETISLGIGQGYNNFTMLQMATAVSTLSSGGQRFKPRLVHEVEDMVSGEKRGISSQALEPIPLKPEQVTVIRDAMNGVTIAGTSARVFAGAGYQSGGKTGTAQAVGARQNEKYSAARMAEHLRDHSLYIAFAPLDQPRVALAVIVENAGWGSVAAAPIARRVLDYLLVDQYPSEDDIALVREGKGAAPIGTARKPADVPLPTGVGASVAMGLVAAPDPAAIAASAAVGSAPKPASAPSAPASSVPRAVAASAPRPIPASAAAPGGRP